MGNSQTNEKQPKTGKSPAKSKHFIRNLNRKTQGRDSKKHGRKKSDAKRDVIDKEYDKTPDSDNIEGIDNDTVECIFKTLAREGERAESASVQSEVTVTRCPELEARSATRDEPSAAAAPAPAASPSTSGSVFTDPFTPLAVELNQCYYSAESDSAHDEPSRTLTATPTRAQSPAAADPLDMPHDDAASLLSTDDMEKEEKRDVFDDSYESNRVEDEKVMGGLLSGLRCGNVERTHECEHEFRDNRLKASPGQTSFTVSRHRKVELPPVVVDTSLNISDEGQCFVNILVFYLCT